MKSTELKLGMRVCLPSGTEYPIPLAPQTLGTVVRIHRAGVDIFLDEENDDLHEWDNCLYVPFKPDDVNCALTIDGVDRASNDGN